MLKLCSSLSKNSFSHLKNNNLVHLSRIAFSSSYMQNLESSRLKLNQLHDNKGARKARKRKGRGHRSGHGRKSGRGMKGQKAHSNRLRPGYIGGAKPFYLKVPKVGFRKNKDELDIVSLDKIGVYIDEGRINNKKPITMKVLKDAGLCKPKFGVKLLCGKKVEGIPEDLYFHHQCYIEVTSASKSAKKIVDRYKGKVENVFFNRVALKAHLWPWKFEFLPRTNGIPPPRIRHRFPAFKNLFESTEKDVNDNLSFEEKVKLCETNGKNSEMAKKLNTFYRPIETREGRYYRLGKKRYYEPNRKRYTSPIAKSIREDKHKLALLEMKCKLKIIE